MKLVFIALLLLSAAVLVASHSWIACADYTEENGILYDPTKCRGYIRQWDSYAADFGIDRGANHQADTCRTGRTANVDDNYSTTYPKPQYSPGQRVCLAWPSKNHVAAEADYNGGPCANPTNAFIPDGGIVLRMTAAGDTTDTFVTQITPFGRGTHQNGQTDYMGFQNCPNFCSNNDKALCTGCFTVPNVAAGTYSFKWEWVFNPGTPYVNCWDAEIGTGLGGTASSATSAGATTPAPTGTITVDDDSIVKLDNGMPTEVPSSGVFQLSTCAYNIPAPRTVIAELVDGSGTVYMTGRIEINFAGTGQVAIIGTTLQSPPDGGYVIRTYMVDKAVADGTAPECQTQAGCTPLTSFELSRFDHPVMVRASLSSPSLPSNALIACQDHAECESGTCGIDQFCYVPPGFSGGDIAAVVFAILFVMAALFCVFLIYRRYKGM